MMARHKQPRWENTGTLPGTEEMEIRRNSPEESARNETRTHGNRTRSKADPGG